MSNIAWNEETDVGFLNTNQRLRSAQEKIDLIIFRRE